MYIYIYVYMHVYIYVYIYIYIYIYCHCRMRHTCAPALPRACARALTYAHLKTRVLFLLFKVHHLPEHSCLLHCVRT